MSTSHSNSRSMTFKSSKCSTTCGCWNTTWMCLQISRKAVFGSKHATKTWGKQRTWEIMASKSGVPVHEDWLCKSRFASRWSNPARTLLTASRSPCWQASLKCSSKLESKQEIKVNEPAATNSQRDLKQNKKLKIVHKKISVIGVPSNQLADLCACWLGGGGGGKPTKLKIPGSNQLSWPS